MSRVVLRAGLFASAGIFVPFSSEAGETGQPEQVVIEAPQLSVAERDLLPATTESITIDRAMETVNVVNTEDALKYLPNILIRKRHIGDTQAPMTTRTSGVGSSARSLIYADGVLLSALIGNNNSFASPRWGMVAPDEIERIDVMYGPFSAQYPGNSIGAVVEITTRMPEEFTATAHARMAWQDFSQYGTDDGYPAYEFSAGMGDRIGRFSWRANLNHLDATSQPLAFVTATRPAAPSGLGTPVTGAFGDLNRNGAPIAVLGASGLEYQRQQNATLKLAYDITPAIQASYTVGLFENNDRSGVETYLADASGAPVYSGALNIGGYAYAIGASAFSTNTYRLREEHWMHSAALRSNTMGVFDWSFAASSYDFARSDQRTPSSTLPAAFSGGAGTIMHMDGTGWFTPDAKGVWRPFGIEGAHIASFGVHWDRYRLRNNRFNAADWLDRPQGALGGAARGDTETVGLWIQDVWRFAPSLRATLGGRYEFWRAFDGFNYSLAPALSSVQPSLNSSDFSPKASLSWSIDSDWTATASFGGAYRYPTVSELYQTITTGAVLTVPNPDLKPEHALSAELAVERRTEEGRIRLSLFGERVDDALISQSAPLLPGSTTLFNYVQNIDRVRTLGVEAVLERNNVLIEGLSIQGSVTYTDPRIESDPVFPAAAGKQLPQVPLWRTTWVATYRPDEDWTFTLAARYSARVFGAIDNSDIVTHTYQGFDSYFVMDARVGYRIAANWNLALGIDNLNNRNYFLFHPFPQRTAVVELSYTY
jgi:iron complex outermembrane receptor protein